MDLLYKNTSWPKMRVRRRAQIRQFRFEFIRQAGCEPSIRAVQRYLEESGDLDLQASFRVVSKDVIALQAEEDVIVLMEQDGDGECFDDDIDIYYAALPIPSKKLRRKQFEDIFVCALSRKGMPLEAAKLVSEAARKHEKWALRLIQEWQKRLTPEEMEAGGQGCGFAIVAAESVPRSPQVFSDELEDFMGGVFKIDGEWHSWEGIKTAVRVVKQLKGFISNHKRLAEEIAAYSSATAEIPTCSGSVVQ